MPDTDAGERVTPVLDFPSRDGLAVHAVRVDYEPGGFSRVPRHPAGACVYVIDGCVMFGLGGREPVAAEGGRLVLRAAGRAAFRVTQRERGGAGELHRVLRARRR
jgi:quercetin dioxygenase-like cupin family protein